MPNEKKWGGGGLCPPCFLHQCSGPSHQPNACQPRPQALYKYCTTIGHCVVCGVYQWVSPVAAPRTCIVPYGKAINSLATIEVLAHSWPNYLWNLNRTSACRIPIVCFWCKISGWRYFIYFLSRQTGFRTLYPLSVYSDSWTQLKKPYLCIPFWFRISVPVVWQLNSCTELKNHSLPVKAS